MWGASLEDSSVLRRVGRAMAPRLLWDRILSSGISVSRSSVASAIIGRDNAFLFEHVHQASGSLVSNAQLALQKRHRRSLVLPNDALGRLEEGITVLWS